MRLRIIILASIIGIFAFCPQLAKGQITLTSGNLIVVRTGDGTAFTAGAAAQVSLLNVSTSGALQNTFSFTSTGTNAFTNRIDTTTGGFTSLSQDNQYLYLGGYNADAGTTGIDGSAMSRVVARIGFDGTVDTSTRFAFSGAIRGTASAGDGSSGIYVVGENRVSVVNFGATTATTVQTGNLRAALVVDNKLLVSSGSGTAPFSRGVAQYSPLPSGAATAANLITQPTGNGLTQFIALDRDTGVAGIDTIYAADRDAGTIDKYSFDGTTWTARGTLTTAGIRGLTAVQNGLNVDVYYTNASELRKASDSAIFNADFALSGLDTLLLSSGTNFQFQGVSFTPVPEPSSILAIGAGVMGVGAFVRRKLRRGKDVTEPVAVVA